jgi:hypothetical protein
VRVLLRSATHIASRVPRFCERFAALSTSYEPLKRCSEITLDTHSLHSVLVSV